MRLIQKGLVEHETDQRRCEKHKVIENNQVAIMGEIVSDFTFSHEIFGEGFYMVDISVNRLSDSTQICVKF